MPPTAPDSRVHVVVGILRRRDGHLLMQRRLPGTPCAGQWEFPGGKVEAGESPRRALARELEEEIGIMAPSSRELVKLPFDYATRGCGSRCLWWMISAARWWAAKVNKSAGSPPMKFNTVIFLVQFIQFSMRWRAKRFG